MKDDIILALHRCIKGSLDDIEATEYDTPLERQNEISKLNFILNILTYAEKICLNIHARMLDDMIDGGLKHINKKSFPYLGDDV